MIALRAKSAKRINDIANARRQQQANKRLCCQVRYFLCESRPLALIFLCLFLAVVAFNPEGRQALFALKTGAR
jgi:hypothetical protein